MAEYIGGICWMPPRKRPRAASTSWRPAATGRLSSVSPVTSWVSVTWPRRRPATYSLRLFSANSTARVACPTNTGRTPVAMGSRVPPWPTRFSWRMPRILAQTSMLVQPWGLSMMRIPLGTGRRPLSSRRSPAKRVRCEKEESPARISRIACDSAFRQGELRRGPALGLVDDEDSVRHGRFSFVGDVPLGTYLVKSSTF